MRFAVDVTNFRSYADPRRLVDLAREAEAAGWDGFFIWDHVWQSLGLGPGQPAADPWVALGAIAAATERVRLGPMVTPVARRRPWKVARELLTLDHLSGGRVVFGAGLGAPPEEFTAFGEEDDARVRAAKLDEGLEIIRGLLTGEPFSFDGEHYRLTDVHFRPKPVQDRIPVWIGGGALAKRPMQRAARWDGVFPMGSGGGFVLPDEFAEACAFVRQQRTSDGPYDFVVAGLTPSATESTMVAAFRDAGATWWLETLHDDIAPYETALARVRQGPPQL